MARLSMSSAMLATFAGGLVWASNVCGSAEDQKPTEQKVRLAKQAWEMAAEEGWIQGLRAIELIRPDVISVTLDGGITGAIDSQNEAAVAALGGPDDFQKPAAFRITSPTDPNYQAGQRPQDVGRLSYEGRNCMNAKTMWPLFANTIYWHEFYLFLPYPLRSGHTYQIAVVPGRKLPACESTDKDKQEARPTSNPKFKCRAQLDYDEKNTTTKVIKISQVAYSALAKRRFAYLGWWAGDRGAVAYSGLDRFAAIDEATGKSVLEGRIERRRAGDVNSGEDVYEMDISALSPGRYHIHIPGFARSDTFSIGGAGIHALYYHTLRAFFHQRCGQELRPPWTWVKKPACHTEIWESGEFVAGSGAIHHAPGDPLAHASYTPRPGERKMSFQGGYHDAADFDTFSYHLPATAQILAAYELYPAAFGDGDLDLPESGNGVPDLLDEAEWGLSFYLQRQYENGAVPLGRVNQCDARTQNIEGGKEAPMPPFGVLPPARESTPTFAAVAAQFSRAIRKYDAAKADRHLAAAKRAFDYASVRSPEDVWKDFSTEDVPLLKHEKRRGQWLPALTWAASELLLATGEPKYNEFVESNRGPSGLKHWSDPEIRWWPYLMCDPSVADPPLQEELRRQFLELADTKAAATEEAAYRMGNGNGTACGWGACQGANHGDLLLRAYVLSKDQKYLDAACFNADWHLGANPLSKTLISGMGYRAPRRPEISWFLYEEPERDMSGRTVAGIAIYGIGPPLGLHTGEKWPLWRSWRDVWDRFAEIYSEFTVPQTCGPAAMLYATLYGMEKQQGLVPEGSKPNPLAR
ncbi:MAG: glycoside hydrolase family 9 protein [Pirellulaceae bacterium]|nr:glycoside hydrolase family 9 protein [Pirellulaceae bacterium]